MISLPLNCWPFNIATAAGVQIRSQMSRIVAMKPAAGRCKVSQPRQMTAGRELVGQRCHCIRHNPPTFCLGSHISWNQFNLRSADFLKKFRDSMRSATTAEILIQSLKIWTSPNLNLTSWHSQNKQWAPVEELIPKAPFSILPWFLALSEEQVSCYTMIVLDIIRQPAA